MSVGIAQRVRAVTHKEAGVVVADSSVGEDEEIGEDDPGAGSEAGRWPLRGDGSCGGLGRALAEDAHTTRADEQAHDDEDDAPQNLTTEQGENAGDDQDDCQDPEKCAHD
ncbi:hypothetical protein Sya03_52110 [Spirilliplanes yamanashiensis]|uniref:Uncharacterized protein n=1 Tax=Spirilliplanes yamanashiensis TaxID=42233 RepID=A0A8J3YDE5_9ACTN|nr:hypothetical protein Sya03_52110 [Spirilliplanes yamanashiensis]